MEVNAYWVILLFGSLLFLRDLAWAICALARTLTPSKEKESSAVPHSPI